MFPAEPLAAAVVVGVGEQAADDNVGIGDIALAADVFEVAAEAGEGVETEAGLDDALDDVAGFGWAVRVPLVCDGFGDGSEFDDGEFTGEAAFEGVDAGADLGEGHGYL